jgi:hypothetical protein
VMAYIQLLFAKAIDDDRTALVIKDNDRLQVGVANLTKYEWEHHFGHFQPWAPRLSSEPYSNATLHFRWEWFDVVDSWEKFVANRGWERGPQRHIEQTKALPAPVGDHD